MKTLIFLLLISFISCTSKIEKYGYAVSVNQKNLNVIKSDTLKNFHLKVFNDPYQISNEYRLVIRFDSKVIYNGNFESEKLFKIAIPSLFFDKAITPSVIIFKEGNEKSFYFEGKTQFYLHNNDNFLSLFFPIDKDYSDRIFIASQEIIGL